jgi:hypothetical protein
MNKPIVAVLVFSAGLAGLAPAEDGFTALFDGKSLDGWKLGGDPASVTVENGTIKTNGEPAHLFYIGPVKNHDFKDFELKLQVMTRAGSNSGVYFHTEFQEKGWPAKGFEAQVNNSFEKDPRRTGSLYAVKDVTVAPVKDDEWWDYDILVKGNTVTLKVNGKTTVEWTQPEGFANEKDPGRKIGRGTFALQAHDKGSTVYFRNSRVKPLD